MANEATESAIADYLEEKSSEKALAPANDQGAPPAPEFLTLDEAADLLRVHRSTLTDLVKQSCPPWAKPIGRQVRVSRTALLDWFKQEVTSPKKKRQLL